MTESEYSIFVCWSTEDKCFVARVEGFPTLSTFGDTIESATEEAQVALEGFLEIYAEEGYDLPTQGD